MPISFSSVWLTRVRRWTGSSSSSSSCASGTFSVRLRRDQVGHPPRIVDALHDHRQLGLDRLAQAGQLVDVLAHRAQQRLDAQRARRRLVLGAIEAHAVAGALGDEALDARAAEPLHQHLQPPLGELAHPHDHPDGAGAVELLRASARRRRGRAARPGSRDARRPPAPWPPPPSTPAASPAAARSCTGRRPGRGSAAAGARRGSPDPLATTSFVVTRRTVSRRPKKRSVGDARLLSRYLVASTSSRRASAIDVADIAQMRPNRSTATVAHVAGQDDRRGARIGVGGAFSAGASARSPLPVATQTRPLPSVARPRVASSVRPERPPALPVEAREPLGRRRPDRAVAAARDRRAPARWPGPRSRSRCAAALPASG